VSDGIADESPPGGAGRTFVEAARQHARAHWKFRAAIAAHAIATFRSIVSDPRMTATRSARDPLAGRHLRRVGDGIRADDDARGARRRRRELLDAARSLERLGDVRAHPRRLVSDRLDQELGLSLCQARWDKTEPAGIADVVLAGTDTMVPAKQLLLQNAIGDDEVSNVGTYWEARTMGISVVTPSPLLPWGVQVGAAPIATGSALVLYDGGAAPLPPGNTPPPKLSPSLHDLTRNAPAARRQIRDFYAIGQIVNECAGACTCTAGACN
jgi:hypothetical protein